MNIVWTWKSHSLRRAAAQNDGRSYRVLSEPPLIIVIYASAYSCIHIVEHCAITAAPLSVQETSECRQRSRRYRGTIKDLGDSATLTRVRPEALPERRGRKSWIRVARFPDRSPHHRQRRRRRRRHPQFNHINIERALPALRFHSITGGRARERETPRGALRAEGLARALPQKKLPPSQL